MDAYDRGPTRDPIPVFACADIEQLRRAWIQANRCPSRDSNCVPPEDDSEVNYLFLVNPQRTASQQFNSEVKRMVCSVIINRAYGTDWQICKSCLVSWQGCRNFSKSRSHFKILSTRRVTWSKFHVETPKMLGPTVQTLVITATWRPEFVHLRSVEAENMINFVKRFYFRYPGITQYELSTVVTTTLRLTGP
jgi:hypothetical protein